MNNSKRYLFHRFCDDLCEELLSYLSLSYCLALECVSKQFKRNVFNKQNQLLVSNTTGVFRQFILNSSDEEFDSRIKIQFENILKKCVNIQHIIITPDIGGLIRLNDYNKNWRNKKLSIDDQLVEIICKYCHHLRSIDFDDWHRISQISCQLFGEKFGHSLQTLKIASFHTENFFPIELLLSLTHNLIECDIDCDMIVVLTNV